MTKVCGIKYPRWWTKKVWLTFAPGVNQYEKVAADRTTTRRARPKSGPASDTGGSKRHLWEQYNHRITANGHYDFLNLNEVPGWRYVPSDKATWYDDISRQCHHLIVYRERLKQWEPDDDDTDDPVSPGDSRNYGYCEGCKAYFVVDSDVKEFQPRQGNPDSDRWRTEAVPQASTLAPDEIAPVPKKKRQSKLLSTEVGVDKAIDSGIIHNRIADLLWLGDPSLPDLGADRPRTADGIVLTHVWAEAIAAVVECSPRQVERVCERLFGEVFHAITPREALAVTAKLDNWLRQHEAHYGQHEKDYPPEHAPSHDATAVKAVA